MENLEQLKQNFKDNSYLFDERLLNNIEKQLAEYEVLQYNYDELKHDWEEMSKQIGLLNYFRNLCDRQQKILEIIKECPFILQVLFERHLSDDYCKKYMWNTIPEEDKRLVEAYFK